ncbi:hypothetical protein JTE90_014362 [Oedothorax gibbosus]|uniref:Uncharacterized protein n=1 Tax=Oedothorax gibbosus TaxID=931172 RepID=A0AAV6UDQ5_9ARAC|nr:hypothetical protein JTE90_014362 [Oedothorax gibbosus]
MIAKVTILFAALVAVNASALLYGHGHLVNTGVSARSQVQDGHGNYAFGYDIKDGKGATNSRSEVGDGHGNVKGSYTLADIDGRARKVEPALLRKHINDINVFTKKCTFTSFYILFKM